MFARKKTLGQTIKELFGKGKDQAEQFEALEDALLEADIGPQLAMELVDEIRTMGTRGKLKTEEEIKTVLAERIAASLKVASLEPADEGLYCFLFLGVNGVGKTTSIAKLAHYTGKVQPQRGVVLAAGDTFRAAACQQLETHGERLGLRTVSQGAGADSAAVIFDALASAMARGEGLVLADTAGRLHNKAHLVKELEKVDKIVRQKIALNHYRKVLVLDATTGRNGVQQAEVFNQAVGIDAVILSKYDSSARGGMVLSICRDLGLGFAFIGTGESYEDFEPFDPLAFSRNLVGL